MELWEQEYEKAIIERKTAQKKTKPNRHIFARFVCGLISLINFSLVFMAGGLVTISADSVGLAIICLLVSLVLTIIKMIIKNRLTRWI